MNPADPLPAKKRAPLFRFGPNELDLDLYELRRNGRRVPLSKLPLDLLIILVAQAGRLMTREELVTQLWGDKAALVDTRAGLNNAINRLRNVLIDNADNPRYIQTVIGRGYRFVGVLETIPELVTGVVPIAMPDIADEDVAPKLKLTALPAPELLEAVPKKRTPLLWMSLAVICALIVVYAIGETYLKHDFPAYKAIQVTTNDGADQVKVAAISPSGDRVAYADTSGVHLRSLADGFVRGLSFPRRLDIESLAWSPDEKALLASGFIPAAGEWEVWSFRLPAGPSCKVIPNARRPVISSDSRQVASLSPNEDAIYLSAIDGTGLRMFSSSLPNARILSTAWSEHGTRLLTLEEEHNFTPGLQPARPEDRELHLPRKYVSRSLKGLTLAVQQADNYDSLVNPSAGNKLFLLTKHAGLWQASLDESGALRPSAARRIPTLHLLDSASVSRARDVVAAVVERGQADVYLAETRAGSLHDRHRLTMDSRVDFPNTWTKDGTAVVFESNRSGHFRLYRQQIDSSDSEILTDMPGEQVASVLTPDGRHLLFRHLVGPDQKRWAGVYRMPVEGGVPTRVRTVSDLDEVRCPSKGTTCVERSITDKDRIRFFAFDPRSGTQALIASTTARPVVFGDWDVSPDGTAIALPSHQPEHPEIEILSLNGSSAPRTLSVKSTGQLWGLHWSSDGKSWYGEIRSGQAHRLCLISESGDIRELYRSPYNTWAIPSFDGTHLAFLDYSLDRNVWIWRN